MFNKIAYRGYYLWFASESRRFLTFLNIYIKDKILILADLFEERKNTLVKGVLMRRGKPTRIFLHISAMTILTVGVIVSPFIQDIHLFQDNDDILSAQGTGGPQVLASQDIFNTQASEKPRDKIITYKVTRGDTLSTIASKFGVSEDTIKWRNNLRTDSITEGDVLEILPVTGIAHKVERGDTIYAIAKKYNAYPQAIADFPFNDFANPQKFSLVEGQILIVPDGVPPREAPRYVRPTYIAQGPASVTSAGFTWPVRGSINQGFVWYHKGIDIGGDVGTPVFAAQSGAVSEIYNNGWNGGYGIHVIIQGENGYGSLYAHMSGANVSQGQAVEAGRTLIGWIGLTGRTTGAHLHFEIRGGPNGFANPLTLIQ